MLLHAPRSARIRSTAPTPLGLADLADLTRGIAAQVHTGAHVVLDPERRWYRRLYADPFVDVWLISWATEQAASCTTTRAPWSALTVVSGELQEHRWVPGERARDPAAHRGGGARRSRSTACSATWSTLSRRTP